MVDNLITLFESNATDFSTNGLGSLNKAVSCTVDEKRNGEFELELIYPVDDIEVEMEDPTLLDSTRDAVEDNSGVSITVASRSLPYEEIKFNRIIVAKSNPYSEPQPFRIYAISKPISGLITVNAQHISYDLSGVSVSPFSATSLVEAFQRIKAKAVGNCPFTFWTDKSSTGNIGFDKPVSMRSVLGGTEGSILDAYGGEYEFDKFVVKLHNNRGIDRGVTIRYGKNLTDITQDENCANVYTAIYPYYYYEDEEGYILVELDEKIVNVPGEFNFTKILPVDLSEYFDDVPTKDELRYVAQLYINAHQIGVPDISLTVSFIPLSDTEDYKDYALLERVNLCDTVTVEFPKLKISATSKCIATKYNVLSNRYISIELGNARSDLSTSFNDVDEAIKELPTKTFLEKAIENATNLITGQNGGYVILNPSTQPQEILIMDKPSIEEATRVWRWNSGGLGYSSNGYNGPYKLAMTMDGSIVADFINTGTLSANLIKAGLLTDEKNNNYWNLSTGKALFTNLKVRESLSLVDNYGLERAYLGYQSGGTSVFSLKSAGANEKVIIDALSSGGRVMIGSDSHMPIAQMTHYPEGGAVNVYNSNGVPVGWFMASDYGGHISIKANDGTPSGWFYTTENGGHLSIDKRNGDASISAYIDSNQKGIVNVEGDIFGNYLGKKWVRTTLYFETIAVNRTFGNIYCSLAQQVNYRTLGLETVDDVWTSLVTMEGGKWAWPINTRLDGTYLNFVLARPTNASCNKVKVSILFMGS